jgi:hypothetical protein
MQINDTAFPAPVLVTPGSLSPGTVARDGDNYIVKMADNTNWFDLTNNVVATSVSATVQPVTAVLTVTPPAA